MGQYKQCPHCLQSFDTDLVDIENHKRNCKQHIEDHVKQKCRQDAKDWHRRTQQ